MLTLWLTLGRWASTAWLWVKRSGHWKLVAAAMTAAILILIIFSYRANLRENAALKSDLVVAQGEVVLLEQARVSDSVAVSAVAAAKDTIAHTEAEQRVETIEALEAHPDWANEPIPDDVIHSLRM